MNQNVVRYLLGATFLLLLLGHAARLYQITFINQLDAIAYDTKVRLTLQRGMDDRIVILDIDERSLSEVGRWPWQRAKLAAIVDKLFTKYEVGVVGVDVVFAEPDTSSGLETLDQLAKGRLKDDPAYQGVLGEIRGSLDFDQVFAAALEHRPVILGFYLSNVKQGQNAGALPEPVLPAGTFRGRNIAFQSFTSYGANLLLLQRAAAGAGHFNQVPDFDGIVRRVPLLAEYQGAYYESLSLAVVRAVLGNPKVMPGYAEESVFSFSTRSYGGLEWLELPTRKGTLQLPVDEQVSALIPYRGPQGSFRYISLADILAEKAPVDQLKGRIVLIGTTAPGLLDLRATPVGGIFPGVEIHANLIAGMLDGKLKQRPAYIVGLDVVLLLAVGAVMVLLLPRLDPQRSVIATASVLIVLVAANLAFWSYFDFVVPVADSLLLVLGLFGLNMSWGYFVAARSKRQMADLFGQYVVPELVEKMSRSPESYNMEVRTAELSVLFSDIRDFTSISERLEPRALAQLINEYLGAMTEVIRKHRGTLDKYMGDAIMAFWGAPVDDSLHARQAVLTALEMQVALEQLNRSFEQRGWPALKIGVGVNTGPMRVGDMGSSVRKAYTVMGDAVNLGSRLEGITKIYGVGVLVGEGTRKALKGYVFREIDRVRVKGKDEPVAIFEPVGTEGSVPKALVEEIKLWHQALRLYRNQDWDQADVALFNLTRMAPERELYRAYMRQIAVHRKNPPGPGWDGVTKFETK
ncbi:MAG: adenylate/guanylate cyclase domain-containing protein [Rhodocyclaceae bacterium]|nr:adenylate/guanylate cyclase domain-containing protein [Rhodocyclaceae bacterium]MBX3667564.1 adenylate/guanylate cyclase domain-containing protein [Rhodocyclaceae bacterium]